MRTGAPNSSDRNDSPSVPLPQNGSHSRTRPAATASATSRSLSTNATSSRSGASLIRALSPCLCRLSRCTFRYSRVFMPRTCTNTSASGLRAPAVARSRALSVVLTSPDAAT